ncbi:MAG: hypothetical protein IJR63_00560 [Synergistaceae bacterium]|nr:hypothetical protein [Synergistaceae bacterium]
MMKYTVMVDDNYHFADESERYMAGEFDTYAEAEDLCRKIVRESLEASGWNLEGWKNYGDSPFIPGGKFRASSYAEELSRKQHQEAPSC